MHRQTKKITLVNEINCWGEMTIALFVLAFNLSRQWCLKVVRSLQDNLLDFAQIAFAMQTSFATVGNLKLKKKYIIPLLYKKFGWIESFPRFFSCSFVAVISRDRSSSVRATYLLPWYIVRWHVVHFFTSHYFISLHFILANLSVSKDI